MTGTDGSCVLPLSDASESVLAVRREHDLALLPQDRVWWDGWNRGDISERAVWFVFDDRGLYRPGEQVHLKGWIRTLTAGPAGDVAPPRVPSRPSPGRPWMRWATKSARAQRLSI